MPKRLTPKSRYEQRKRYYAKHRKHAINNKRRLTEQELILIWQKPFCDVELSRHLNRSVEAIQVTRCKIKKGLYIVDGIKPDDVSNSVVKCPECLYTTDQEELDMFGGLCETCANEC